MNQSTISSIAGKNIITYSSTSDRDYSYKELESFLKRFQLNKALSLINQVSFEFFTQQSRKAIEGPAISAFAYIAMTLIEVSNDYRSKVMTKRDLQQAVNMFFGLLDPLYEDDEVIACLLRYGRHQFDFDREKRNALPRTLEIYNKIWPQVNSHINISEAIQHISGLSLEELLALSYLFTFSSGQGTIQSFTNLQILNNNNINSSFLELLSKDKQNAFLNWVSCEYAKFRQELEVSSTPSPIFKKFRFNPLFNFPVINPDRKLIQGESKVSIIPLPQLLYERVSRGLYFDLTSYFSIPNKKGNQFRDKFGVVFQEYIGNLFKTSTNQVEVLSEWMYSKSAKHTPDWILIKNDYAILVEVKQSGLFLEAKTWGNLETVKQNLRKSIGSAVEQLWNFERDLQSDNYSELTILSHIKCIEKLAVTYDRSYFLNSIIRDLIRQEQPILPQKYHWHIISVDELERVLGLVEVDLFQLLENKRLDPEGDVMDFRDYIGRLYSGSTNNNIFLDSIQRDFFAAYGIDLEFD